MTQACGFFRGPRGVTLMDTRGFGDPEGYDDVATLQEIFDLLKGRGLTRVRAVIWTFNPDQRENPRLQTEAKIIDSLAVK